MPAAAFENEFGGFFRTRAYSDWNFTGEDQSKLKDAKELIPVRGYSTPQNSATI